MDDARDNADAVAALPGFAGCLVTCGIDSAAVRNAIMRSYLCNSIEALISLTHDDLATQAESINKTRRPANQQPLIVNVIHVRRLKALRLWAIWQVRCSLPALPELFDADALRWGLDRLEFEERVKNSESADVPEPPQLKKIGFDIWQGFWRQFKNYCDTKRGAMKIPISYVFRDHLVPTPEIMAMEYADSDESLMMKVTLAGPDYKFDNKTVWGILIRLVGNGSAWPFIKPLSTTFDGRRAIEILKTQSQGTASLSSRRARAQKILDSTIYDGRNNRFSFDAYVEQFQFAFTELDDCGTPLMDAQKVDHLLKNYKASNREAVSNRVIGSPLENDFGLATSDISQYLAKTSIYNGPSGAKRAVASIQTKFTDTEWHELSFDDKEKVKAERERLKKIKKKTAAKASTPPTTAAPKLQKRKKVAVVATAQEDDATSDEDLAMKPPAKKRKSE